MENTSYATIMGNTNAPQINSLADTVRVGHQLFRRDPPQRAELRGQHRRDYFGIQDDNQFYCTAALASTGSEVRRHDREPHGRGPEHRRPAHRGGQDVEGLLPEPAADPAPGLVTSGPRPTVRTRSSGRATRRAVRVQAQPVRQLHRHPGDVANMVPDTQPGPRTSRRTSLRELQPGRARPVPRHARRPGLHEHRRADRAGDAYVGSSSARSCLHTRGRKATTPS